MLFGSRKDKSTETIWSGDSVFPYDLVPVEQLFVRLASPLKVVPRYVVRDIPTATIVPTELIGKRLVFVGRSCSGKTREAIELIRKINSIQPVNIYVLRTCLSAPIEFPQGLPTSNIILLIDDLPRLPTIAASEALSEWRHKLPGLIDRLHSAVLWFEKHTQPPVTVIITVRDDEYKSLLEKSTSRWFKEQFTEVPMPNLAELQNAEFFDNTCDAFEVPRVDETLRAKFAHDGDGTFERYAHFFSMRSRGAKIAEADYIQFSQNKDMLWHAIHLRFKNEERAIFRALSLFRFYNIPVYKSLLVEWCVHHVPDLKGMKLQQIELTIDFLARQYFNLWENRIFCHDSRLKFEPVPFAHEIDPLVHTMLQMLSDKQIRPQLLGSLCGVGEANYLRHQYELAQQVYETILKHHHTQPLVNVNLAMLHYALGTHRKKKPTAIAQLKTAIQNCQTALHTYTEQQFPQEYAQTQHVLALLYTDLTSDDREENARIAIDHCKNAIRIYTRNQFPEKYAAVQVQLGVAYLHLTHPTRDDNLASAIDCFVEALTIFNQSQHAEAYAFTSMKLGLAYQLLNIGNKMDNFKNAMENYFAALKVATRQAFPLDHVDLQVHLGSVYLDLPEGEVKENVGQALDCFREALTVYVPAEHSHEYANAQYLMGIGFAKLPGDRVRNLQAAKEFFKNALNIYTRNAFPTEHHLVSGALESTIIELEKLK